MPNMCVSATGYENAEKARYAALSEAALYKYGVAAAQIAINASSAISNFKKLNDIASLSVAIEEEEQSHLKNTFWPAEETMLAEFSQDTVWDTPEVLAKRYAGRIWPPVAAGFAKNLHQLKCEKPRYCASAYARKVQELMTQRALARSNVTLWSERIAWAETQAVKETDWKRKQQVLGFRQGLIGQAASLIEQAQKGFAGALGKSLGGINSAIQLIDYTSTRGADVRGTPENFARSTMQTAQRNFADQVYQDSITNQSYNYTEDNGLNYSVDPSPMPAFDASAAVGIERNYSVDPTMASQGFNLNSILGGGTAAIEATEGN